MNTDYVTAVIMLAANLRLKPSHVHMLVQVLLCHCHIKMSCKQCKPYKWYFSLLYFKTCLILMCYIKIMKQNEAQSMCAESTHKGVN